MAKPWILPGAIGIVSWVAPAAYVVTEWAPSIEFHQAKEYLNWRLGWACQNNTVPDGTAIAMVIAATASQPFQPNRAAHDRLPTVAAASATRTRGEPRPASTAATSSSPASGPTASPIWVTTCSRSSRAGGTGSTDAAASKSFRYPATSGR